MNWKYGTAVILSGFVAWTFVSAGMGGAEMETPASVTAQSDFSALQRIVPIPGTPDVLWARLPMGRISPPSTVPGPTDLMLLAMLDYGTLEKSRDVTADIQGVPETIDLAADPARYEWLPEAVLSRAQGSILHVIRLGPLAAFGNADVSTLEGAPHILLLRKVLP